MYGKITIFGKASEKKTLVYIEDLTDLESSLLDFLRSKNIPVASSCSGKGVCQKCIINESLLSCTQRTKNYIEKEISISYL